MNITIVGGGKIGYYLARTLVEEGHQPHIIEVDPVLSKRIANELNISVYCGDGTSIKMLELAKTAQSERFISVTGKDENNLVACQLAKQVFGVPITVARVNNPKNVEVMARLGVDAPISSTANIASIIQREVDASAINHIVTLNRGNASINEITLPENFSKNGISLMELKLPESSVIVSITREGELIIPRGNAQLFAGDKVILVAQNDELADLSHFFELN